MFLGIYTPVKRLLAKQERGRKNSGTVNMQQN